MLWYIVLMLSKAMLFLNDSSKWTIQSVWRQDVIEASNITSDADFAPGQPPPPT